MHCTDILKAVADYIMSNLIPKQMLVSGGVDSTVCAALLYKALSAEQVIAFHIDNGFMRKNESALVEKALNKIGLNMKSN